MEDKGDVIAARVEDGSPILRYEDTLPVPGDVGEIEAMALYAGQSAGLVSQLQPAHDIVKDVADEAIRTLQRSMHLLPKDNASV